MLLDLRMHQDGRQDKCVGEVIKLGENGRPSVSDRNEDKDNATSGETASRYVLAIQPNTAGDANDFCSLPIADRDLRGDSRSKLVSGRLRSLAWHRKRSLGEAVTKWLNSSASAA
jgi:hypothetical protein